MRNANATSVLCRPPIPLGVPKLIPRFSLEVRIIKKKKKLLKGFHPIKVTFFHESCFVAVNKGNTWAQLHLSAAMKTVVVGKKKKIPRSSSAPKNQFFGLERKKMKRTENNFFLFNVVLSKVFKLIFIFCFIVTPKDPLEHFIKNAIWLGKDFK